MLVFVNGVGWLCFDATRMYAIVFLDTYSESIFMCFLKQIFLSPFSCVYVLNEHLIHDFISFICRGGTYHIKVKDFI